MIRTFATLSLIASLGCAALAQPPRLMPPPVPPGPVPEPLPLPPRVDPALKPVSALEQPTAADRAKISAILRELFLQEMPTPLVKANDGWGQQKEFVVGKLILRDPKRFGPDAPREKVNDGLWRRYTVTARDPAQTLAVSLPEMIRVGDDKVHVTLNTVMDVNFRMEQQLWKRGHQFYSGETRGHCTVGLQVKASVVHKTVANPDKFLPDLLLTVTATDAKLFYDKVVIDHTAGLDGDEAHRVGMLVFDIVRAVRPNLEKQLLEKANAAIVKAVGTREFKIELEKVINGGKK